MGASARARAGESRLMRHNAPENRQSRSQRLSRAKRSLSQAIERLETDLEELFETLRYLELRFYHL